MANVIEITDFSAPELDVYARLTEAQLLNRFEPAKGMFIAESPKVIERALSLRTARVAPPRLVDEVISAVIVTDQGTNKAVDHPGFAEAACVGRMQARGDGAARVQVKG